MSKNLTPEERDRRATLAAEGRLDELAEMETSQGAPTWIWVLVGLIVLVSVVAGAVMGFVGGQIIGPPVDYQALLGAVLVDRDGGVTFDDVEVNGPSGSAGIQDGDILKSIDAQAVGSAAQARRTIERYREGDTVRLVIQRSGRIGEYLVTLGVSSPPAVVTKTVITVTPVIVPPPPAQGQNLGEARLGIKYRMLIPEDGFDVSDGALIVKILQDGVPADVAGLEVGDILIAIDGRDLSAAYTLEDALSLYAPGERVRITIWRAGKKLTRTATLGG